MSKMKWNSVRVSIEVKTGTEQLAPFSGSNSEESRGTRRQLAEYVAKVNISQNRTSTLAVTIHKRQAYFTRWDPAGVLIAESFDYTEEPEKLFLFAYRVGQMNDAQLGYDPTLQRVEETDADVQAMRALRPELSHHRKYFTEAFPKSGQHPIHRLEMKDKDGKEHRFLIGRAQRASQSAFGRGTKGYVVYDVEAKALRYLKDYWRLDARITLPSTTHLLYSVDVKLKLRFRRRPQICELV